MRIRSRPLFAACLLLGCGAASSVAGPANRDLEHIREELGVNDFTAPSIELIVDELRDLRPIPFEKIEHRLPKDLPHTRAQLALCTGQVIADGFLAVAAEKQSRIEPVGRTLLKASRGLGVAEHVTRRSGSILELAGRNRWSEIRRELVRAQAEVEAGMMALKDEEIAHLVSLGGWLRGLEIASEVVSDRYTAERAQRLLQPALLDYFVDRVQTLDPKLKQTPTIQTIAGGLAGLRQIARQNVEVPITLAEVQQILNLARTMNKAVTAAEQ